MPPKVSSSITTRDWKLRIVWNLYAPRVESESRANRNFILGTGTLLQGRGRECSRYEKTYLVATVLSVWAKDNEPWLKVLQGFFVATLSYLIHQQ